MLALQTEYTACAQFHLNAIQDLGTHSATKLHRAVYQQARESFSLKAAMLQRARDKAIETWKSHVAWVRRGKRSSVPEFNGNMPIGLAERTFSVTANGVLRVSTYDGFLWLPLFVQASARPYLFAKRRVSELVRRGKDWYLMLTVEDEDVPIQPGERPVFGLDLGLANTAVLVGSNVVKFWDGKPLRYTRGRYARYRQALQQKRKIGMVKRSKGKESRWVRDLNHKISRQIVDIVAAHNGVLCVEKLLGIRDRTKFSKKLNRMVHGWPFAQLLSMIHYKAALAGVPVIEVDPRKTSQRCSCCGHQDRSNRPSQAVFCCKACEYEVHADVNAARNIALKPLPEGYMSSGVGLLTRPLRGEVPTAILDRGSYGNLNLVSSESEARPL
ncbi:MAG TPA: transposase [Candidatus Bipolaricaulota bacterium]